MSVYAWGRGEDGQLGLGDTSDAHCPALLSALAGRQIQSLACGSGHTVVLSEDGEVYSWGRGDDGRLGHGDNQWKYVPRLVGALSGKRTKQVVCGSYHTAAVTEEGELYTWGGGMYGKLGHGSESGHNLPFQVKALAGTPVQEVSCGSRHTVALLESGEVYTWGDKENGVSGHGDTEGHQYLPRPVLALADRKVVQIAACGFHTSALADDGRVWSWGEGKFGRLGHGNEHNLAVPRLIEGLMEVHIVQVACGGFHSAAITDSGRVFTWGGGEHGQLGHGDKVNKTAPYQVEALNSVKLVQVTCGWSHTVVLSDDSAVYTWGNGDHGKLGHGDEEKVTVPRLVEALQHFEVHSIASYNEHTAALTDPKDMIMTVSAAFLGDLKKLINNPELSDVTFIVEDQPVYAYRSILAARCDHFRAMFQSGMRESHETEIRIRDIRLPIFNAVLEYLYTDHVDISPDIVVELYIAADLYTIDRLKAMCEAAVISGINVENAAITLRVADELHVDRLREVCMAYIVRHFDVVSKSPIFATLSRELILDILQRR